MKQPLLTYAPDADPTAPGVITSGIAFVPSFKGYKGAPSTQDTQLEPLVDACVGAAGMVKLDESVRFFAGTNKRLYEATTATAWTDRSAGATDYAAVNGRWRFAQFGNVTIAASKENLLQESTTGDFAAIATSIKADIIETVGSFVICFNTDDTDGVGTYGDVPNSWWCAGAGTHSIWTPSIASNCYRGTLTSVPGRITAGRRFGAQVVAYKQRGLYLGYFAGPPFGWIFDEIPSDTGTWCQESVVNIGTPEQPKHFFVGLSDFYIFDGSRPQPVGAGIKEAFFADLNTSAADKICTLHDRVNSLVYVYYPSGSSTTPNACVVWNYVSGKWGRDDRPIEFASEYVTPSMSYADLGTYYTTYASLPASSYGGSFLSFAAGSPVIFNTSHKLQTLTGAAGNSQVVTGDYGDDLNYGLLRRVKPTWLTKPTSATLQCKHRASLGDSLINGPQATMYDSRFDALMSARWHRFELNMVGDWEANKLDIDLQAAGRE